MSTIARVGRGLALALALVLAAPADSPAQPQAGMPIDLPQAEPESEGRPLFGYLAFGAGCIAILFAVSMSARR